jgi:tetratricopeptide (TPR) repeat protein
LRRIGNERALAELERAQRDDPLSSICTAHASIALTLMGRHEEAVRTALRGHALDPDAFSTQLAVASAKTGAGDLTGALPFAQSALQLSGRHPWALALMTHIYARQGERAKAEAIHRELESRAISGFVQHTWLSYSAIALGRIEEAMDQAFKSVVERDAFGPWFLHWTGLEPLQSHPRYPELKALLTL